MTPNLKDILADNSLSLDPEQSAEDAMAVLGVNLKDVLHELEFRRQQRIARAYQTQRRAAKQNGERRILRTPEGGGEIKFQIHPVFYHYWGQRLGYECWRDDTFVREMLRDNPEIRIRNADANKTVVVDGLKGRKAARPGVHGRRGRWAA